MEIQRFLLLSVHMNETPAVHRFPEGECKQAVIEQVLRLLRLLFASCQVCWACQKLMPVGQNFASDERGILESWINTECQINALSNVIDNPVGDEHLDADLWVGCLE